MKSEIFLQDDSCTLDDGNIDESRDIDPIKLLKECRDRFEIIQTRARREKWIVYVACYTSALEIRKKPERFSDLVSHPVFNARVYELGIDKLLRLTILIALKARPQGSIYKTCCRAARKLQPYFEEGLSPLEMLKEIEKSNGINRLGSKPRKGNNSQSNGIKGCDGHNENEPVSKIIRPTRPKPDKVKTRDNDQIEKSKKNKETKTNGHDLIGEMDISKLKENTKIGADQEILEVIVNKNDLDKAFANSRGGRLLIHADYKQGSNDWKIVRATYMGGYHRK